MKEGNISSASVSHDRIAHDRSTRAEVLVVEDDDDLRSVVGDILRDDGLSVVEAPNGSAAIDYLLSTPTTPSLILLDMNMPIMSGREMLHVLQGYLRFSTIPVLVVTCEILPLDPVQLGAVERLQKPFNAEKLLSVVRRYTGGRAFTGDCSGPSVKSSQGSGAQ